MTRPKYVASCSGGKDSVATLLLAAQHNEPLDEAVFSEVMFDKDTSGEVPEHRDFIYDRLKPFCEKELGIKFTILHADKTYDDVFHHVITRGPHKGEVRGFAWAGICAVNRDCKIPPVRKFNAALSPDTVSYVGIAEDEPKRLVRLDGVKKVSLLAKYGMTEADAYKLCQEHGLLSPIYAHCRRNGCWFCPNASDSELLHMVTKHPDTGMALGVDMYAAEIVLDLKSKYPHITLESAIPCETQAIKWSVASRERYYNIAAKCDKETMLQREYTPDCMDKRNRYMVDHADYILAVWNGCPSGTGNTVRYAHKKGKSIIVINPVSLDVTRE